MVEITRRKLMLGGGAAAATLAAGGAWIFSGDQHMFVAGLIRHILKSELIAPGAAEAFTEEYLKTAEDPLKVGILAKIHRVVGYDGLDLVFDDQHPYEHFKRRVATSFMLNSTFFHRDTPNQPVEFTGLVRACNNPFARFD